MSGVLASVDQRTQLVGENRLELLMFKLVGPQLFAINVFKVQEVLRLPQMTRNKIHHVSAITSVIPTPHKIHTAGLIDIYSSYFKDNNAETQAISEETVLKH